MEALQDPPETGDPNPQIEKLCFAAFSVKTASRYYVRKSLHSQKVLYKCKVSILREPKTDVCNTALSQQTLTE